MSLPEYIGARLSAPFKWGEHDCMHFAAGWAALAAGRDILAQIKPWTTAIQAMRRMDEVGGLAAFFDLHFERIDPAHARDGDLAVVRDSACIFSGAHVVSVGETGLVFINRTETLCAWRC